MDIDKHNIVVLPVWIGYRRSDCSDFHEFFLPALYMYAQFESFIPCAVEETHSRHALVMSTLRNQLVVLANEPRRAVVCFIVTTSVAESDWFPRIFSLIRSTARKNNGTAYTIVLGPDDFKNPARGYTKNPWLIEAKEARAAELNAVYLRYNPDAPSCACERVVELINRLVGMDLPTDVFPDYDEKDIRVIAWNIDRENFNKVAGGEREGSIQKYPIENGKPILPYHKVRTP